MVYLSLGYLQPVTPLEYHIRIFSCRGLLP